MSPPFGAVFRMRSAASTPSASAIRPDGNAQNVGALYRADERALSPNQLAIAPASLVRMTNRRRFIAMTSLRSMATSEPG